jgi:hypothetical protein
MDSIGVLYDDREVGRLSAEPGRIRFQYAPGWL